MPSVAPPSTGSSAPPPSGSSSGVRARRSGALGRSPRPPVSTSSRARRASAPSWSARGARRGGAGPRLCPSPSAFRGARPRQGEGDRRAAQRDELLERLAAYDDHGQSARWRAPSPLSLATTPPGAAVTLERRGRAGAQPLGRTPLQKALEPGSYVLV